MKELIRRNVFNVETGKDELVVVSLEKTLNNQKRKREDESTSSAKAAAFRAEISAAVKKIKVERDAAEGKAAAAAEDDVDYQEEETKIMQIFSAKQTDAIDRLKDVAKGAGADPTAIDAAAKIT